MEDDLSENKNKNKKIIEMVKTCLITKKKCVQYLTRLYKEKDKIHTAKIRTNKNN